MLSRSCWHRVFCTVITRFKPTAYGRPRSRCSLIFFLAAFSAWRPLGVSGKSFQCKHPESTLRRPTDAPRLSRDGAGLFQGFGLGGFAEQALIHENQLALVPKELPFAQAALLGCGVVTGAGSVLNTANVSAGDSVVIFGAGSVGLNAISGARIAGASRIVVIDIQQKRLDEARRFGATDIIDSTKANPVEAVRDLLRDGADHVFDFVGLKIVADQGLAMLGVGGGLYLVGVSIPDVHISLNITGRPRPA